MLRCQIGEKMGLTTKVTKNELKKFNHKGHKDHIGREARKMESLRPLRDLRSFAFAQDMPLQLNHPKGTAIAVPYFVTFVLFVVKSLLPSVAALPC